MEDTQRLLTLAGLLSMHKYKLNCYVASSGEKEIYPLPHPNLRNHYRVPVKKLLEEYRVYVDRGQSRIFTYETVPDYIKSRIVMADASEIQSKFTKDEELLNIDMFIYRGAKGMEDTAWRASDTMYIVVLNNKELNNMKGTVV
jgi:hypothetical protein